MLPSGIVHANCVAVIGKFTIVPLLKTGCNGWLASIYCIQTNMLTKR